MTNFKNLYKITKLNFMSKTRAYDYIARQIAEKHKMSFDLVVYPSTEKVRVLGGVNIPCSGDAAYTKSVMLFKGLKISMYDFYYYIIRNSDFYFLVDDNKVTFYSPALKGHEEYERAKVFCKLKVLSYAANIEGPVYLGIRPHWTEPASIADFLKSDVLYDGLGTQYNKKFFQEALEDKGFKLEHTSHGLQLIV